MAFRTVFAVLGAILCGFSAQAYECYYYNVENGTAVLGAETRINSKDRVLINQGTVWLNEGASIVSGGNTSGQCNYVGVDQTGAATLYVNGGTFWCSTANGSGWLRVSANNFNQTATVFVHAGSLTVDAAIWTCTRYDSSVGQPGRGVFLIDGGVMTVGTLNMGATSDSTGTTEVYLDGGLLMAKAIVFHGFNKQCFRFRGGTLKATAANVFDTTTAVAGKGSREIKVEPDTISTFDNNGFGQLLPPLTGTGTLRLKGSGTFTFPATELTYKPELAGTTIDLGTADGTTPCLTVGGGLTVTERTTVNVALPEGASGRIPIFANCGAVSAAEVATHLVHPRGTFVVDGTTVYLDTTVASPAELGLVYSAAAGGDDTPAAVSATFLSFFPTAGTFNVNGDSALTLSGAGTVISDDSAATQTVNRALAFSTASAGIATAAGSTLVLKGGLTATTPVKSGPGTLVLDNATRYPAALNVIEGTVDFGGKTYQGALRFLKESVGRTVTFRNGTWKDSEDWRLSRTEVHFGEGFNFELTHNGNGRMAIGYPPVGWPAYFDGVIYTGTLCLDPGCGTVTLRGDTGGHCNFIAVDNPETGRVFVNGGVLHAAGPGGTIRIAAGNNALTVGLLKVAGGELQIDSDLTLATVYNGTSGGKGTAEFDLESGVARIGNLYLGASTSSAGKGTVRLTGGDLYVKTLKCWGNCTQTLVCDGATIHAVQNSTAAQPLLTADAGADAYPRSYTIGANGLTLDTAGYATAGSLPFTVSGPLTVTGGGSFVYSPAVSLTNAIAVLNDTTLAFAACRQFDAVTLGENATLQVVTAESEPIVLSGVTTFAAGAKIVVDVSGIECAQTTLTLANAELPAGRGLLEAITLMDRDETARYATSLGSDGKTVIFTLIDRTIPCFAVWTGKGDPTNVRDPGNWECRDAVEGLMPPTTLPTERTTIRLTGETTLNVPPTQALTVKDFVVVGPVTLGKDCDWRGLMAVTIPEGLTIDLKGHRLTVSDLAGAGAITDTSVEYVPLEYIESTHTGLQWIDTGHTHTANTRIECVINACSPQADKYAVVFGAYNGTFKANAFSFCTHYGSPSADNLALVRTGFEAFESGFFYNEKVRLVCEGNTATWSKVDDPSLTGSIVNTNCTVDSGTYPLALFNVRTGTGVAGNAYATMKLYSFQIWEGQSLVRDYVPRRRGSDGAAGLWDRQNGVFYPSQHGNFSGVAATNDVVAYGELHLDVPQGQALTNSTVELNGAVKVVKEGAGTLTYAKADLGYYGGTKIAAGTFKAAIGGAVGAMGAPIEVDAGATFDINGQYDFSFNEFVLNGGTLTNTGANQGDGRANLRNIRLTENSFVRSENILGQIGPAYSPCRLDLAGHTLTVETKWDFFLHNVDVTAGTFKTVGGSNGGFLNTKQASVRAPETIFDINTVLSLAQDAYVKDLIYRRDSTPVPRPGNPTKIAYGSAKFNVYGTFTPVTDYFHNVRMLDGSTLDLSAKDWDWSVTSKNTDNGTHGVSFADGAVVTLDFGTRRIPDKGRYALMWGALGKPANIDDKVKFIASGVYASGTTFKADATGLFAARRTLAIFIR